MHRYKVTVTIMDENKVPIKVDKYTAEANNKSECMTDTYWKYSFIPRQRLLISVKKSK